MTNDEQIDTHCLVCLAVRLEMATRIIAQAMTVEASKLYAVLHYTSEAAGK